ncbi:Hypothetical predicted protein [Mytilus galloprovincialis]|uniref:Reverse transcriptase domain-containing protein n=1 Tax=Mytilus galloprovincialis TaxID=29158 RepID=A0A8B6BPH0_MYTGA|nr:Hypothetical predicted protein [Mytilus galloprovincialis]
MDNYRGIAVTPVISKLFECTILPRLTLNFDQSSLQFGFTKGLSMLMASLIITEARAEGVRQGGILSPFLYKVYVNNLLEDLKSHSLGLKIGTNYVGCPTCADDIAFLSNNHQELQCMLSVATHHARQSRVTINPTKTKAVILNKPKKISKSDLNWTLGNTLVYPSEDTTHLGLIRAELKENNLNIDARISIARRTLYSLMNTGLHGTNGLNPQTSYKIYQSYVIPRLLYGMEILPLNQCQLDIMARFHTKTLRNIQSLPTRTATGSVFMLLGALTIEAEIHKRQLSFLYSVLSCNNSTIQGLVDRQVIMNIDNHLSFFCKVTGVLTLYDLPSISTLSQNLPSKLKWKATVKLAIQDYWTKTLIKEIETKSSLTYLDKTLLRIGHTHPVWTSLSSTVSDVKKGAIKVQLLTGTYELESHRSKFSGGRESALCKCCGTSDEDIIHFQLLCPALHKQRKETFSKLKSYVISVIGTKYWSKQFKGHLDLIKLIVDSSFYYHHGHCLEIGLNWTKF